MTTTLEHLGLQTEWPGHPAIELPARPGAMRLFGELPVLLTIAAIVALMAKTLLVQAFFIPSESMVPTLLVKDRVIVNKLVYQFRDPVRGEVIVFVAHPDTRQKNLFQRVRGFLTEGLGITMPGETDFIKRVMGLPGETIEVTADELRITRLDGTTFVPVEPYTRIEGRNLSLQEPFVVPEGHVFVMGDNRNNSSDSRSSLGPVPIDRIVGKAFVRVWPVKRMGAIGTPSYDAVAPQSRGSQPADQAGRLAVGPPLAFAAFAFVRQRRRVA